MHTYLLPLFLSLVWAQVGISAVESSLNVCDQPGTVSVTVTNSGSSPLTNVQLQVQSPPGILYVAGSVSPATVTVISTNPLLFGLPDIPAGTNFILTFQVTAGCDILPFLADQDNEVRNTYDLTYFGGSASYTSANEYQIVNPALQYISITNQNFTATALPQIFTRTFTVTNAGTGRLALFRHSETAGSGLAIQSASGGTVIMLSASNLVLEFNSTHFTSVGNHDAYLDPGESISFSVTYQVQGCSDASSTFALTWGCNTQVCQTVTSTGSVDFSALVPNLTQFRLFFDPESSCYGDQPGYESKGRLWIRNSGSGPAKDIYVDLYTTFWPPDQYDPSGWFPQDRIDTNSIALRIGAAGPLLPRQITYSHVNSVNPCFTVSDVVKHVRLYISGPLNPGDTLYIDWNQYSCELPEDCPLTGYYYYTHGIGGDVTYSSVCDQVYNHHFYQVDYTQERYLIRAPLSSTAPGSVSDGQSFSVCFELSDHLGNIPITAPDGRSVSGAPSDPSYQLIWTIQLPPVFSLNGTPQWVGDGTWSPTSTSFSGTTLTLIFTEANRPSSWERYDFKNSVLCVPLIANCGAPGNYGVTARLNYNPNPSCNPAGGYCTGMPATANISLNCPVPCPDGIDFRRFAMYRISYGEPDNDNDGVADGSGALDFSRIRLDRLMHTDTAEAFLGGRIRASSVPSWNAVWALIDIDQLGDHFIGLEAEVTIRKGGTIPVYSFTRPVLVGDYGTAPNGRRFGVDLRTATLISAGVVPPTFTYEEDDSIEVRLRVRLDINIGGSISPTDITPYFYTTPLLSSLPPDLTPHSTRYSCNTYSTSMQLIGWYATVGGPAQYTSDPTDPWDQGCGHPFWPYYYLSIGPCCNNYCDGNLFPYEYRSWAIPTQIVVQLPTGWSYASDGNLVHQRYPHCTHQETGSNTVSPVDPNANPLIFNLTSYFTNHGGILIPADDGMFGLLVMRLRPSCLSRSNPERDTVHFTVHFQGRLNGSVSDDPSLPFTLVYDKPRLSVEGLPKLVTASSNTIEWRIKVSNLSNVTPAHNSFVYFRSAQGNLVVTQVLDEATMTPIAPIGDIYPLGLLSVNSDRYLLVRATFSSCQLDTLFAYAGWQCGTYPPSASAYSCYLNPPLDTLRYIPTNADILLTSTINPNPSNLCDTLTVELTLQNGGGSAGYNPFLFMLLPNGITYVPNSAEYSFPNASPWQPLADPSSLFIFRVWDLSSQTNPSGITATGSTSVFRLRFKVVTNCNYVSGLQIRFFLRYRSYCGQFQFRISASTPVTLSNVIVPYNTSISLPDFSVDQCQQTLTYTVSISNLGIGSTTSFDSVRVSFPAGITYISNSTVAGSNFTPHEPNISTTGTSTILQWGLQSGHGPGATMSFSFQVQVGPSLPGGTYTIPAQSLINATQTCGSTTCNTFYSTGTALATLTVNRPAGLWTGDINTDWYEPFNWGDCEVPTCSKDVLIPTSPRGNRFPVIAASNVNGPASCRDITVEPSASLTLASDGQLDICRHTTFQASSLLNANPGSQVRFVGSTNQLYEHLGTGEWWDVTMAQSVTGQRLLLRTDLILDGTLTLNTGVIDGFTFGKETFVRQASASAVTPGNLGSYVSGVLRRNINATAIDGWYYLPVGDFPSGRGYELAQLQFDAVPATQQIRAAFYLWPGAPPSCAVQTDCGANFGTHPNLDHGYWVIDRLVGGPTSYHLRLFARGYTNATGTAYAIVKRPTGSGATFEFEGTCEGAPFDQANQTGRLNVPDFSEFAIAQSPIPLPAMELRLRGKQEGVYAQLEWISTLEPEAVQTYLVERSTDRLSWQALAFVEPSLLLRAENGQYTYHWRDPNPLEPHLTYFYRIWALLASGEKKASNAIELFAGAMSNLEAWIIPNPSQGEAWLEATLADMPVRIVDMTGRVLWEGRTTLEKLRLPNELASGVYLVEVAHLRLRWIKQE